MVNPADSNNPYSQIDNDISQMQNQGGMAAGFQQLLGPWATPKDIQNAINNLIKSCIDQIKQDQQKAVEAIKKMRDIEEGKDPS